MKLVYEDDEVVGVMMHRQEAELIAAAFGRMIPSELEKIAGYDGTNNFVPCKKYAELFNVHRTDIPTYNNATVDLVAEIYHRALEAFGGELKDDKRGIV